MGEARSRVENSLRSLGVGNDLAFCQPWVVKPSVLSILVCLALATSLVANGAEPSARPPNIVHIIADDVGWDDISCYGAKDIATPNIDKLAKQGMRFTSFYAPHSTCTPTRAALLTGCYAARTGVFRVLFPNDRIGLHSNEVTIAELLRERGYATACVGKWHLGHLPEFLPPAHGFDLYFGIPYPNDHGPERLDKDRKSRGYPALPLFRGTNIVEQPAQLASLPQRFTKEAVQFIEANKARPFYLHLANIETHTPWLVPKPFQYTSKAGVYGDAVQCLDWTVGEVVAALDRLGLTENTLVVFTSDNGPLVHRYPELEGIYGHAATVATNRFHALREGKYQSHYEGGTRVAFIARWPGKIPASRICDELVAGFDLFNTFAKLAGAAVPTDRVIDGKDISPLLLGEAGAKSPHESFYYYNGLALQAVRSGQWKLVFGAPPRRMADGDTPSSQGKFDDALFDLSRDLGETKNVAKQHPEVVERLKKIADQAREDLGDARLNLEGKGRRPAGKI
jgi:arylsulfatase A-like enzyme